MNIDGTVHDAFKGTPKITNKIQIWLDKNNFGKK